MNKIIETVNLVLKCGDEDILNGVTLGVQIGEAVALIGENGSGKTMTLRAFAGLEDRVRGVINYRGKNIIDTPAAARVKEGISFCPSSANIFPRMSVKENILLGKHLFPGEFVSGTRKVYGLFPVLETKASQRASSLSGGEQQMLALARAIMPNPELLLLDEFSLGLSEESLTAFTRAVKNINDSGTSILFVEQNFSIAAGLSDRDYYMINGKIAGRNTLQPKTSVPAGDQKESSYRRDH